MNVHRGKVNRGKVHRCKVCGVVFSFADSLARHVVIHSQTESHTCHVCGVIFSEADSLAKHALIHTNTMPHTCQMCGVVFNDEDSLSRHFVIHTTCGVCGKAFTKRVLFALHMRSHRDKEPRDHLHTVKDTCDQPTSGSDTPNKDTKPTLVIQL